MRATTAKRLGKPYRHPTQQGRYQTYIVTFDDDTEAVEEVPVALGRQAATAAKRQAESGRRP